MFHPNVPPLILRIVNGYVATDTALRIQQFLVENILCNKLNIQNPSLCNIGIYCTQGREYFPRPPASGNIPTLGTIYADIPLGRVEYLVSDVRPYVRF